MAAEEDKDRRELKRAYKRGWIAKNSERHRAHSRATAARKRARDQRKKAQRERSKRWAERNPEKVREQQHRWRENNRERIREQKLAWRERNLERAREISRASSAKRRDAARIEYENTYRRENREKMAAIRRRWQQSHRDQVNQYNREWKQREKRRIELGLPRAPKHRTTKNEQLVNERAAKEFFARRISAERRRRITVEAEEIAMATHRKAIGETATTDTTAARVLAGFLAHRGVKDLIDKRVEEIRGTSRHKDLQMDLIAIRARGGTPPAPEKALHLLATKDVVTQLEKRLRIPIFIPQAARRSPASDLGTASDTGPVTGAITQLPRSLGFGD